MRRTSQATAPLGSTKQIRLFARPIKGTGQKHDVICFVRFPNKIICINHNLDHLRSSNCITCIAKFCTNGYRTNRFFYLASISPDRIDIATTQTADWICPYTDGNIVISQLKEFDQDQVSLWFRDRRGCVCECCGWRWRRCLGWRWRWRRRNFRERVGIALHGGILAPQPASDWALFNNPIPGVCECVFSNNFSLLPYQ